MTLICQAIDTTRDLIACHDSDTRYDEVSCRSAVAAFYLPIAGLVVGALQQLHGYGIDDSSSFTPDVAMAIATSSITTLGSDDSRGEFASQVVINKFLKVKDDVFQSVTQAYSKKKKKERGSSPVGSTRNFFFPSMPMSLSEECHLSL